MHVPLYFRSPGFVGTPAAILWREDAFLSVCTNDDLCTVVILRGLERGGRVGLETFSCRGRLAPGLSR